MNRNKRYLGIMIFVDSKMGEPVESIKQMSSFTTRMAYQPEVTTLDDPTHLSSPISHCVILRRRRRIR